MAGTRDPGKALGCNFKVSFGSDSLRDAFIGADLPINETLGARLTFGTRTQDGYTDYPALGKKLGDTDTYTYAAGCPGMAPPPQ
jgi:hypothetical protein